MRKVLIGFLILFLCFVMFVFCWYDLPSIGSIYTYNEIKEAYLDYKKTLDQLESKNDTELPAIEDELDADYVESDSTEDNVIKAYNDNKKSYEDLVAYQKNNYTIDAADIYDIEYIWTACGGYAKSYGVQMKMEVAKSEADLDSQDYVMCNLDFQLVGLYQSIANFLEAIETDSKLSFQINDFFAQGYYDTAINQDKEQDVDTNNIPLEKNNENEEYYSVGSGSSTETADGEHALDIVATFKVYNIPLNRKNVTNIKDEPKDEEITENEGEEEDISIVE